MKYIATLQYEEKGWDEEGVEVGAETVSTGCKTK